MDIQLQKVCAEFPGGWRALYESYLPEGYPTEERPGRSELELRSPFPGSTDKNPSTSINLMSGVFNCQHMRGRLVGAPNNGGTIVQFIAYLHYYRIDKQHRVHGDFGAAERDLRIKVGMAQPIDEEWYRACQIRMATKESEYHIAYRGLKPWSDKAVRELGIGYCTESNRIVIPVHDRYGKLVNCKLYNPNSAGTNSPKMVWKQQGLGPQNLPFPYSSAWEKTDVFFFTEGETDAVSLHSLGLCAISGTMGANATPDMGIEGSEFCLGRDVIIWCDADMAGQTYASKAAAVLQPLCSSIRMMKNPEWEGMSRKRDASEYINHCLSQGMSMRQIADQIIVLSNDAEIMGAEARFDQEPIECTFDQALDPTNFGTRIVIDVRILSIGTGHHLAPIQTELACRVNKGKMCEDCPMSMRHGRMRMKIDHRNPACMDMSMVDNDKKQKFIKRLFTIPEKCDEVKIDITEVYDVQVIQANKPYATVSMDSLTGDEASARRAEIIFISPAPMKLEIGLEYKIRGFLVPSGKGQRSVILADRADQIKHNYEGEHLSPEQCALMRKTFNPHGMKAIDALKYIADDLSVSVTGIRHRTDMHMLFNAVWHSTTSFDMAGEHVARGWIEAFVIGDTRCGKSAAFKSMANWYGVGVLVDCKMQTVPGLLGAVETSNVTGERFVLPGLMPLNDKRGPIGFDEYTGPRMGRTSLLEALSSTRAEGVVTITKAAHAKFLARVSNIWMANPGDGRLLADIPGTGVERLKWLCGQPEDIARFDVAMAVTQQDVSIEVLLSPIVLQEPKIPREIALRLMEWARTRNEKDFKWTEDATKMLSNVTRRMIADYDQSIPLVESATQRIKIAKFAVANALSTFSSPDGRCCVITHEHVIAAYQMFSMFYNKPSFGYDAYSAKKRKESGMSDVVKLRKILEDEFGENLVQSLNNLLRSDSFDESMFRIMCQVRMDNHIGVLRRLASVRAIEPDGKRIRLTRAFIKWINEYLSMQKAEKLITNEDQESNDGNTVDSDRVAETVE